MTEQGDGGGKLAIKDSEKTFAKNQNANGVFAHKELIDLEETGSEFWTGRRIRAIFSMDDTEFSQFHQEIERLTKGMPYEGEGYVEPINEFITVQDAKGKIYQYDVDLDAYMHGEILSKIDVEKKRKRLATREKEQANERNAGTQDYTGSTWSGKPDSGRNTDAAGRGRGYAESGIVAERAPGSREAGYSSRESQISQSKNAVSGKLSVKDSDGNTLTPAQQEYFKDSKVRDADGKLLVMYHQTANDFTVFDPRRNGAGSSDTETPYGIFLKSSPDDIGLKGKKQMMLYANITNPLVVSNREELREKLFELSGEYRKLYEEAERIDEEYHQKYLQLDEKTKAAMSKWRQNNPEGTRREAFESPEVKRLREMTRKLLDEEWPAANRAIESKAKESINLALESNGYDGVILQNDVGSFGRTTDAYIALRPEQVKNVDNSAPTTNPDIRYSIKDEAMSDRMLLANTLFTAAQNDAERRRLNNYKAQIDVFDEIQDKLVEKFRWWDSTCAAAQAT